ncbi:RNase J family beta-CASP ribonuclease [Candidatus Woesearchaeota archaeon]|jgi:ribonuclease J|nr:RNase J family beta-CASP ribonuclease [Candidatus Woesearchaeota archaeon]
MTLQICGVGGFNEVGKNMTAVRVDDEVVILDMGLHLDAYVNYTEDADNVDLSAYALSKIGAIPDIEPIKKWKKLVKAIIPTHAHLDHVGAIPFMSNKFTSPIICTPFTAEVIFRICKDEKIKLNNEIKVLNVNCSYKISDNITIEFVNMTHSTPQTVMVIVHTKYGKVIYGNDFKFDNNPTLGKKPNFEKLKRIGEISENSEDPKSKVVALIVDCTRANNDGKTPSEQVARELLKDVMLCCNSEGKAVIVTTFSSHIARLKSIIEFGNKLERKVILLGRSLGKYVGAAEAIKIVDFSREATVICYKKKIARMLEEVKKDRSKYLIVCTGHQAEPKSVLSRIISGEFKFELEKEDHIIFSCDVIPTTINIANRKILEEKIKKKGVRLFKKIHVSGHAAREDLRDLINMVKPKHIIPAHGNLSMKTALVDLCQEMGYETEKQVHIIQDGQFIDFVD